jgi:hypothetical protein
MNLTSRQLVITTRDLGKSRVRNVLSEPRIEINDWAGRDIRWVTLADPFTPSRGSYILELGANVNGREENPTLTIREGTNTLYESQLPVENDKIRRTVEFRCRGRSGYLYVLLNLSGESARLSLNRLRLIPWGQGMSPSLCRWNHKP